MGDTNVGQGGSPPQSRFLAVALCSSELGSYPISFLPCQCFVNFLGDNLHQGLGDLALAVSSEASVSTWHPVDEKEEPETKSQKEEEG